MLKEKHDVAQFIYEELQLAPWHLTGEFIDVHKKSEGSGMMMLSGLGDPSGFGEGFSFLRKVDNKPAKAATAANSELNAHVKKITGTEDDLRKLTMKEMADILRKFGHMDEKQLSFLEGTASILALNVACVFDSYSPGFLAVLLVNRIAALKRWDRVHVIRLAIRRRGAYFEPQVSYTSAFFFLRIFQRNFYSCSVRSCWSRAIW